MKLKTIIILLVCIVCVSAFFGVSAKIRETEDDIKDYKSSVKENNNAPPVSSSSATTEKPPAQSGGTENSPGESDGEASNPDVFEEGVLKAAENLFVEKEWSLRNSNGSLCLVPEFYVNEEAWNLLNSSNYFVSIGMMIGVSTFDSTNYSIRWQDENAEACYLELDEEGKLDSKLANWVLDSHFEIVWSQSIPSFSTISRTYNFSTDETGAKIFSPIYATTDGSNCNQVYFARPVVILQTLNGAQLEFVYDNSSACPVLVEEWREELLSVGAEVPLNEVEEYDGMSTEYVSSLMSIRGIQYSLKEDLLRFTYYFNDMVNAFDLLYEPTQDDFKIGFFIAMLDESYAGETLSFNPNILYSENGFAVDEASLAGTDVLYSAARTAYAYGDVLYADTDALMNRTYYVANEIYFPVTTSNKDATYYVLPFIVWEDKEVQFLHSLEKTYHLPSLSEEIADQIVLWRGYVNPFR